MAYTDYQLKSALPNKSYNEDGTTTDLLGNIVQNPVPEYENKQSLPNKWLNPDGSYSTLLELISGAIDTELFVVVEELPESGQTNKIYLLADGDNLIEYLWTGSKWDPIGMVQFDLSKYSTTEQMNEAIMAALNSAKAYADTRLQDAKDYTDTEIAKIDLAGTLQSAKDYADTKKSEAISSANGYTDSAIQSSITQVLGGSY